MSKLRELEDLRGALALLHWDLMVMMPPRGADARGRQIAALEGLVHDRISDPEMGDLIAAIEDDASSDKSRLASVRVLRREHERATKVPTRLVQEIAERSARTYQVWTEARPAGDFSMMEPHLAELVELKKQEADALGWTGERYDALHDLYEPGSTAAEMETMFEELVAGLKPLVDEILPRAGDAPALLVGTFDVSKQEAFCSWLVDHVGFEFEAGRLDTSPHPFTIAPGFGDTRQTIRYDERRFAPAIFTALHETGHALYEQGIPSELADLPVGHVPSLGLHESQSRLWENQVGRSRAFTDFLLPHLKDRFPEEIGNVSPDEFHRGVNHPQRTLIRVTADELTYNLHVALRFELELAMFRDELEVKDLPEAWDDAMESHVGIRPPNQSDGVLQDMHWSIGALGYFPTYTLGNLMAAQLWARIRADVPDLDEDITRGEFRPLREWLREHVHRHGRKYPPRELLSRVTGDDLRVEPFLRYLRAKLADSGVLVPAP